MWREDGEEEDVEEMEKRLRRPIDREENIQERI